MRTSTDRRAYRGLPFAGKRSVSALTRSQKARQPKNSSLLDSMVRLIAFVELEIPPTFLLLAFQPVLFRAIVPQAIITS